MSRTVAFWLLWVSLTVPVGLFALLVIVYGGNRSFLLIGKTTAGHHQIELACDACHTSVFGGGEVLQKACVNCHGAALKQQNDSHPRSKFTDPRNADRTAILDARNCVTCHREHRPEITRAMDVTMPDDYCYLCHHDIASERPSHKNLKFDTCASAGCHNYHDNRALYLDFLMKHADEPAQLKTQRIALTEWLKQKDEASKQNAKRPLTLSDADAPTAYRIDAALAAWAGDIHARSGVNCSGCHVVKAESSRWVASPSLDMCEGCHGDQAGTFTQGKHGMRLREGMHVTRDGPLGLFSKKALPPMTPAEARLPMKPEALNKTLTCNTCHSAHVYATAPAKLDACVSCHDDNHTKAYFASPHYALYKKERAGDALRGTGVSCATCHMPLIETRDEDGVRKNYVTHNQNENLRPNEKMVRSVCDTCHGLQFTLDALADPAQALRNYKGPSAVHIESIEWAQRRVKERTEARQ